MASDGAPESGKGGKGFAGLDSLLSKVDETVSTTARSARTADIPARPKRAPHAKRGAVQTAPLPQSPGSSGGKRLLKWGGAALVLYLLWIGASSNNASQRAYHKPPAQTGWELEAGPKTHANVPATTGAIAEEQPPVGKNRVLRSSELRYCVSEKIRIEGAGKVVSGYVEADVHRYNRMVADYNSRCGEFRYRSGALESARREAERKRFLLETEGRTRFTLGLGGG